MPLPRNRKHNYLEMTEFQKLFDPPLYMSNNLTYIENNDKTLLKCKIMAVPMLLHVCENWCLTEHERTVETVTIKFVRSVESRDRKSVV